MAKGGVWYGVVNRHDGSIEYFTASTELGPYTAASPHTIGRLERVGSTWKYTATDDSIELFDISGRLTSITNRFGLVHQLVYENYFRLQSVQDPFGRQLTFSYDAQNRLQTMQDPTGQQYVFGYDANSNLSSVTFPDLKVRTYHYENATFTKALTGITDENNIRFATFGYDSNGRANLSEHAGGAGHIALTFGSNTTTETNAFSTAGTYSFESFNGYLRNTGISGLALSTKGPASTTYDINGFVSSRTDWNNNKACYVNDARGLETERVEGLASSANCASLPGLSGVQRKISTEWHATFRLVKRLAEPKLLTTYVFNGEGANCGPGGASTPAGLICSKTIQSTTDTNGSQGFGATLTGSPRTWSYTYNAEGQVVTENGPRTDVTDVTTTAYHANNATCTATLPGASTTGCRGQVNTITNALTHVTTINEYNVHGQPLKITDPNGLVTTLEYDVRQRVTKRIVGVGAANPETTLYEYWPTGLLKKVTNTDSSFLVYTYDDAHRLFKIEDSSSNKIEYTLDAMGNRTEERIYLAGGALKQNLARVFSNLNRLESDKNAAGSVLTFNTYDNQGNRIKLRRTLTTTPSTTYTFTLFGYDALNRLVCESNPASVDPGSVTCIDLVGPKTIYAYDGLDQITSVTDPRLTSNPTVYTVDGLGNVTQQSSPDTGTTDRTFDAAGNVLTQTDAKVQVTSYSYDALNRLSTITYQGMPPPPHTYEYDFGTNGKGRLTKIAEPNSTTDYVYDSKGRLATETRAISAVGYVTSYSYDSFGRLSKITYPGGREVTYTLDSLGRVQQITTTKAGSTQTVVSNVTYRPFGPTNEFTLGNGLLYTRGFDFDGRISSYTQGTMSVGVNYDDASRIFKLAASGQPDRNFTYDELDRLTGFTFNTVSQSFGYDVVGNRTSKVVGAATDTYTSSPTSNRLSTITGANPRTYSYDNNGSVTGYSTNSFGYDTRGRMTSAISAIGTSNYQVNSVGQRIRKTNVQGDTVYHYDAQGRLIAESSPTGTIQKEYIYLGNTPVAVIQ